MLAPEPRATHLPSFQSALTTAQHCCLPVHLLVATSGDSVRLFRFLSTYPKAVKTHDWRQATRLRGVATCFRRFDHFPPGEPDATI